MMLLPSKLVLNNLRSCEHPFNITKQLKKYCTEVPTVIMCLLLMLSLQIRKSKTTTCSSLAQKRIVSHLMAGMAEWFDHLTLA